MKGAKLYLNKNVLEAAQERISILFDNFKNIVISVSGGKDSTVLLNLCRTEALNRNRKINVFFLDQEAEYESTIEIIKHNMTLEGVVPYWYQVPLYMTNATSFQQEFLYAWGPGEEWMRKKDPIAIHSIDGKYPQRFYKFFDWWNKKYWDLDNTVFLVALRAEESLNRFRTVIKNPGWNGLDWTTKTKYGAINAYPIYDWTFEDVWHHIAINNLKYNRVYDFMYRRGHHIQDVRVSYLAHEKSLGCLESLQEFEPETYQKLLKRIPGTHVAARYIKEKTIFNAKKLPPAFKSWKEYRDFLLETTPTARKERFAKRFAKQPDNESVHRQQCKQLLINDYEQNISIQKPKQDKKAKLEEWKKIL